MWQTRNGAECVFKDLSGSNILESKEGLGGTILIRLLVELLFFFFEMYRY